METHTGPLFTLSVAKRSRFFGVVCKYATSLCLSRWLHEIMWHSCAQRSRDPPQSMWCYTIYTVPVLLFWRKSRYLECIERIGNFPLICITSTHLICKGSSFTTYNYNFTAKTACDRLYPNMCFSPKSLIQNNHHSFRA